MRWFGVLVCVLFACLPSKAAAADDTATDEVRRLFELGWDRSPQAAAAAADYAAEVSPSARSAPQFLYAYALVLIRQGKYDDARPVLAELLELHPDHLPARRASIWLAMLTKDYSSAVAQMEALAHQFPKDELEAANEDPYRESASFLGRLFGFLEGPAGEGFPAHLRERAEARIADHLSTGRRTIFDESRQAVLDQFVEMDLQQDQSRADAKSDQEEIRQRELNHLRQQREDIQKDQQTLGDTTNRLEQEFSQRLGQVDRKLRPLNASLGRLETRAAALNRELAQIRADSFALRARADRIDDPFEAERLYRAADALDRSGIHLDVELGAITGEGHRLAAQRDELQANRNGILAQQRAAVAEIDRREVALRKQAARNTADQRRVARPVSGSTSAVRALASRTAAFTTYEPFPLEREKQRILDELK